MELVQACDQIWSLFIALIVWALCKNVMADLWFPFKGGEEGFNIWWKETRREKKCRPKIKQKTKSEKKVKEECRIRKSSK